MRQQFLFTKKEILMFILNIIVLLISIYYCVFSNTNHKDVTILSVISSIIIILTFKIYHKNILSFGFVFILYNLVSHFGFGIIHYLLDDSLASNLYAEWTLSFMYSSNYDKAILISIIGFEMFILSWGLGTNRYKISNLQNNENSISDNVFLTAGIVMLFITALYFVVCLASGVFSLTGSYQAFRAALTDRSQLYNYILIIYSTGLVYVIGSAEKENMRLGIGLFLFSAIILLLTGNKGEVFYQVLAALGVLGYKKYKMSAKLVTLVLCIVFFVIPIITTTRSGGVTNGISNTNINFYEPIMEMGMQIRCVVYSIDRVVDGQYELMMGYSYFQPIMRTFGLFFWPFRLLKNVPINFSRDFSGMGFTQIAESYLNFGILGPALIFGFFGYIIGKIDSKKLSASKLCLYGSILVIMINMSRNTFIFVPGQILIMIILYLGIQFVSKNRSK